MSSDIARIINAEVDRVVRRVVRRVDPAPRRRRPKLELVPPAVPWTPGPGAMADAEDGEQPFDCVFDHPRGHA